MREGSVLRQVDTFNLVCSHNISYLEYTTTKLAKLYASTKSLDPNVVSTDLHKPYTDQIEHKIVIINSKLIFFTSHTRVKRGLINGLGSVVKALTGNLDYDDAVRMEQQISNLRNRVSNVQEKSVAIAQKTITEFAKQLEAINNNQNKLDLMLKNISNHSNSIFRQFNLLQIHIDIDYSLQIILDRLALLEDAMTFAQIGIMHPSIINTKTLLAELQDIGENFPFTPVAPINIDSIHLIEKSIVVKAYSTEQSLNFILEIPSVEPNPYDLIHIYSIPNKQNLTVIPKSKYLVLGGGEYAYIDEDCRCITDSVRICKQLIMKQMQDDEDCVTSLIRHQANHHSCLYARMILKHSKLQKITSNSWLFITNSREVLKSTCGSEITYHTLEGAQLIAISNECRTQLHNITLQTHSSAVYVHDIIPLPREQLITQPAIQYEMQLEDISLDSVHNLINKARNLPDISYNDTPISATPSWTTLILYVIGAGLLGWKLYQVYMKKRNTTNKDSGGPERTSPRFYLKEGGVNMP